MSSSLEQLRAVRAQQIDFLASGDNLVAWIHELLFFLLPDILKWYFFLRAAWTSWLYCVKLWIMIFLRENAKKMSSTLNVVLLRHLHFSQSKLNSFKTKEINDFVSMLADEEKIITWARRKKFFTTFNVYPWNLKALVVLFDDQSTLNIKLDTFFQLLNLSCCDTLKYLFISSL